MPQLEKILVLCPSKWVEHTKNLIAKHIAPAADRVAVIEGGSTRNETIMNAIRYIENEGNLNDDTIIVTHDSVRPFVTYRIIEENIAAAEQFGACDTVIPATDTIVESRDHRVISAIPDRSVMYQGQTPQSFRATKLKKLYETLTEEEKEILTDAAKIFVIKGEPVALVQEAGSADWWARHANGRNVPLPANITLFARLEDVDAERFAAVLWISRREMPDAYAQALAGKCIVYRPPEAA